MPGEIYYKNHALHVQIQMFVEHHYDRSTRHISKYEAEMLEKAADELKKDR